MKKCYIFVFLILFGTTAWAAAPTLEDMKKDFQDKVSKMSDLKKNILQLDQKRQEAIQNGLILQGEMAQLDEMIKKYEVKK